MNKDYPRGTNKIYKHGNYLITFHPNVGEYCITEKGSLTALANATSIKKAREEIKKIQLEKGLMPRKR